MTKISETYVEKESFHGAKGVVSMLKVSGFDVESYTLNGWNK